MLRLLEDMHGFFLHSGQCTFFLHSGQCMLSLHSGQCTFSLHSGRDMGASSSNDGQQRGPTRIAMVFIVVVDVLTVAVSNRYTSMDGQRHDFSLTNATNY